MNRKDSKDAKLLPVPGTGPKSMAGYGPGKGVMPYGQFEAQLFAGDPMPQICSLRVLCVLSGLWGRSWQSEAPSGRFESKKSPACPA
jgi:hypothetical protein